jgi:hypothetical protein
MYCISISSLFSHLIMSRSRKFIQLLLSHDGVNNKLQCIVFITFIF